MTRSRILQKSLALVLCGLLLVQLAGCGTLIYPERRGQTSGDIDPTVAILDGIGLLFFLLPGLVAFAIDFSTGAIYLPGGQRSKDKLNKMKNSLGGHFEERGDMLVLHLEPQRLTRALVEELSRELAGTEEALQVQVVEGSEALAAEWEVLQRPLLARTCF
jgi:hypothetical protein